MSGKEIKQEKAVHEEKKPAKLVGMWLKKPKLTCPECGEALKKGDIFCTNCGNPVPNVVFNVELPLSDESAEPKKSTPAEELPETEDVPQEKKRKLPTSVIVLTVVALSLIIVIAALMPLI